MLPFFTLSNYILALSYKSMQHKKFHSNKCIIYQIKSETCPQHSTLVVLVSILSLKLSNVRRSWMDKQSILYIGTNVTLNRV